MNRKQLIVKLEATLVGLKNDARYWDLRRSYGDYSPELLTYLRRCAKAQAGGVNHT